MGGASLTYPVTAVNLHSIAALTELAHLAWPLIGLHRSNLQGDRQSV